MYTELEHLADIDGIILRRDVIAAGGNDVALRRACRARLIVRVRHGAYALCGRWEPLSEEQRHVVLTRITVEASKTDVVVSHTSAAVLLRAPLWGTSLDDVHLTRTDGCAGRREAHVQQHRGGIAEHEIAVVSGLRVTSATRTALDLTTMLDLERCVPAIDNLLHRGLTTKRALRRGAASMSTWPRTLGTNLAIGFADSRRESVGESRTAVVLLGSGRPHPKPQYKIRDSSGVVVARVDFAWPELGVFLEFDGKVKYQKYLREGEDVVDAVLREKKREEMICRLTGWRCIRLVWAHLARPAETRRYVVSVLDGGPVHL